MMKITRKWILGFTTLRGSHVILFIIINLATVKSLTADIDNEVEELEENPRRKVYDPLNSCRFYTYYYGADDEESNNNHVYHQHYRPLRPNLGGNRPQRPNKKKKRKKDKLTKGNETSAFSTMYGVATAAMKTAMDHFMDDSDDTRVETFESRKFTGQLRIFFKSMKIFYKTMKPEIKYAECARKYFYTATDQEILGAFWRPGSLFKKGFFKPRPGHGNGNGGILKTSKASRHKKKKKKKRKKHKHDFQDFIYSLSESAFITLYGTPPKNGNFIYMTVMPFIYGLQYFYTYAKMAFRAVRNDMLFRCTSEYLAARFCIWIDTA